MQSINELITVKIQESIAKRHRLFLVLKNNKNISTIYDKLANNSEGLQPSVLYLYKEDPDLELTKRIKTDVTMINYKESDRILGSTFTMLILQNYEAITPNILAKSIETIRGGGIIILLAKEIIGIEMEFNDVKRIYKRFNKRIFKSLKNNESILFFDENMKLENKKKKINSSFISEESINEEKDEIKKVKIRVNDIKEKIKNDLLESLFNLAITKDQKEVLEQLYEILNDRSCKTTVSLTAARGRGKSAALGILISLAVFSGFSSICIASPVIENVKTVFEFAIKGLEKLGYKERIDFHTVKTISFKKKLIIKIIINKKQKQIIEYISPYNEIESLPDLLIIDEAAAIPIPNIKNLLKCNLTFMASTINGYEGTGRSLSIKLFAELRKLSKSKNPFLFKELEMLKPIRYAENDPIEKWLNETLLLNVKASQIKNFSALKDCQLFLVDRDILFSYHKETENFLSEIVSLFVSSHYKNSPNDLMIMADDENHKIFVLISPLSENKIPQVLCAIQVALEGNIDINKINREGNLIPWIIYDNYMLKEYLNKKGMRVVRLAVHPDLNRMGYGSQAINLLSNLYLNKEKNMIINNDTKVLLQSIDTIQIEEIDYLGSSFGATEELINFWKKCKYQPIYLKQTPSRTTGEYSAVVMKYSDTKCVEITKIFKKRLFYLFSSCFQKLKSTLCLSLFYYDNLEIEKNKYKKIFFDDYDMQRIEKFCKGEIDARVVEDLFNRFAEMFFMGHVECKLAVLQQCVLLMMGCQYKKLFEVARDLDVDVERVNSVMHKTILNLYLNIK
ncbi:N-acetyltransferase 10 [Gurleya vavrai]